MSGDSHYKRFWDSYAEGAKREGERWPGDEWGNADSWEKLFKSAFLDFGSANWLNCVEIGAGSGKYTIKVLETSKAHVLAADISPIYQEHFCTRLREVKLLHRVTPVLLDSNSATLIKAIDAKGWRGKLDAFYSIDAMVHVDLQFLVVYLITAAAALKPGGKLILTLANCCTPDGFNKLVRDAKPEFRRMGKLSAKFEWTSPDQVNAILPRLGFAIDLLDAKGRDMTVVATLANPKSDARIFACLE